MKAWEILESVASGELTGAKIDPILPEFYSGSGGEWACWVDDINIVRADGKRQNYILESRGVVVVYNASYQEAQQTVEKLLSAFDVQKLIPHSFIAVTLERVQIVHVNRVVAVIATAKIIEEQ